MDKMFALERQRDGKRFEFYSEARNNKLIYIIREASGESQDSVTPDREAVDAFRDGLLHDGYMRTGF